MGRVSGMKEIEETVSDELSDTARRIKKMGGKKK